MIPYVGNPSLRTVSEDTKVSEALSIIFGVVNMRVLNCRISLSVFTLRLGFMLHEKKMLSYLRATQKHGCHTYIMWTVRQICKHRKDE